MIRRLRLSLFSLAALAGLLLLSGCGGAVRKIELPPASPEAARMLMRVPYNQLERFDSDFSLALQALVYKGSFFGHCSIERPGRFSATLNAPFGIRAGELVVDGSRFELSMGNGRMETGDVDSLDLEAMTGLPLTADDLVALFEPLSKPPSKNAKTLGFTVQGNDSLWLWRVDEGGLERQILCDPTKQVVLADRLLNEDGQTVLAKSYHDFRPVKGITLPGEVQMSARGRLPVRITLTYNNMRVNPSWKDDPFQFKTVAMP